MQAFECYGEVLDGDCVHIPKEITEKLKKTQKLKLLILVDENDVDEKLKAVDELSGLLSDLSEDEVRVFDQTLNKRIKFSREDIEF